MRIDNKAWRSKRAWPAWIWNAFWVAIGWLGDIQTLRSLMEEKMRGELIAWITEYWWIFVILGFVYLALLSLRGPNDEETIRSGRTGIIITGGSDSSVSGGNIRGQDTGIIVDESSKARIKDINIQ